MLAYVFWHWKQDAADASDYEARQRAFHATLAAAPPAGYRGSFTAGVRDVPWATDGATAYEDWYFVDDFTALGALNEGAVTAARSVPHDAAAALAKGGTAAVYGLRSPHRVRRPTHAYWFSKPNGLSYAELTAKLQPVLHAAGAALHMRQMVLGPSPEFCVHAAAALTLPEELVPRLVLLRDAYSTDTESDNGL